MKRIVLLGASGSIGLQTVDVIRQHPDLYELKAYSVGKNIDALRKLLSEYPVDTVCVQQEADAEGSGRETKTQLEEFQSAVASVKIAGILRVDRFIADDGKVYVLMFVPEAEIKKALPSDSEFAQRVIDKYLGSLDDEE